jgi:hypothetical protein
MWQLGYRMKKDKSFYELLVDPKVELMYSQTTLQKLPHFQFGKGLPFPQPSKMVK